MILYQQLKWWISSPKNRNKWNKSRFSVTSDSSETLDELRPLLTFISHDLQSGSKLLIAIGEPLQQRHDLDELVFLTRLNHTHTNQIISGTGNIIPVHTLLEMTRAVNCVAVLGWLITTFDTHTHTHLFVYEVGLVLLLFRGQINDFLIWNTQQWENITENTSAWHNLLKQQPAVKTKTEWKFKTRVYTEHTSTQYGTRGNSEYRSLQYNNIS